MHHKPADSGIYMDYQASTPVDPRVVAAMMPFRSKVCGNPHSVDHAFGWQADAAIAEARGEVAELIGAGSDEIVFTSGATEANNLAILGMLRAASPGRRRVLVSAIEHKCVLAAARAAVKEGFELITVPVDHEGVIDVSAMVAALDERTALVSVMTINNEIGSIQPLLAIGALCRRVGALLHTDAAQALAVLPLDVDALGVDLMSLSAHKAYGPKGIGALYVRRELSTRPQPLIHGGGQENGLRSGTLPTPLCVGFGEACRVLAGERADEVRRLSVLREQLWDGLQRAVHGLVLNGPAGHRHPGNLNIRFRDLEAGLLLQRLQPALAASTGSACTSGAPEPSHVLRMIGLTSAEADGSVRFSIGRFTTAAEVDRAITLVAQAVEELRSAAGLERLLHRAHWGNRQPSGVVKAERELEEAAKPRLGGPRSSCSRCARFLVY